MRLVRLMSNAFWRWVFCRLTPFLEQFVAEKLRPLVDERDSLRVEVDEISALQKRDLRQYVFEQFQTCLGMVDIEVHFDLEKGLIVRHGSLGNESEIVVYERYRKYYTQDEVLEIISKTKQLVESFKRSMIERKKVY